MVENAVSFAETLKSRRTAAGMTQAQLAERAGVSVRTVRYWETGTVTAPRTAQLRQLQQALEGLIPFARQGGVVRIELS